MNKRDFIASVVENNSLPRSDARKIVEIVFNEIRSQLLQGEEIRIADVGVFKFKFMKARTVANNFSGKYAPSGNSKVRVGPKVKIGFKTFRPFQREINEGLVPAMMKEKL